MDLPKVLLLSLQEFGITEMAETWTLKCNPTHVSVVLNFAKPKPSQAHVRKPTICTRVEKDQPSPAGPGCIQPTRRRRNRNTPSAKRRNKLRYEQYYASKPQKQYQQCQTEDLVLPVVPHPDLGDIDLLTIVETTQPATVPEAESIPTIQVSESGLFPVSVDRRPENAAPFYGDNICTRGCAFPRLERNNISTSGSIIAFPIVHWKPVPVDKEVSLTSEEINLFFQHLKTASDAARSSGVDGMPMLSGPELSSLTESEDEAEFLQVDKEVSFKMASEEVNLDGSPVSTEQELSASIAEAEILQRAIKWDKENPLPPLNAGILGPPQPLDCWFEAHKHLIDF